MALKRKPRRIHFEDSVSDVLESRCGETHEPEQSSSLEEEAPQWPEVLEQEEQSVGCSDGDSASQESSLELEVLQPCEAEPPAEPPKRKRGRPRRTEEQKKLRESFLKLKKKKKLQPPKSLEEEIEKIQRHGRTTPLTKMIQMRLKGLSVKEIADRLGMKYNTVLVTMRNLFELLDREKLIAFEKYKNEIYSAVEFELLDLMLDPEKKAEAKLQNIAYAFDKIYNARRLEQGKSTANIGFHVLIEDMERRREKQAPVVIEEEKPLEQETGFGGDENV